MKRDWGKIADIFFKFIFNVLYCSCFMWAAVNLFTSAFDIPFYLTFKQANSVIFLIVMIGVVFGKGVENKQ